MRHTKRREDGRASISLSSVKRVKDEVVGDPIERLADLEDKLERKMMIELPVPEGTEVWIIEFDLPGTLTNRWDSRKRGSENYQQEYDIRKRLFELSMVRGWGTEVFATEEEAEEGLKKLKECGEKNEKERDQI